MDKKYYHPLKSHRRTKPIRPFFRLIRFFAKVFVKRVDFIWRCEKDEIPIFICNHTGLSAPFAFLVFYPQKIRTWSYYKFLSVSKIWEHMKKVVLPRWRAPKILYPLCFLVTPVIFWLFRSIEPVPVYRVDRNVMNTYNKAIETYENGEAQVIFAERLDSHAEKVSDYVYKLNRGFVRTAQIYYERTGKIMKFYPCYCSSKLKKLVIGEPIYYNKDIPLKIQRETICNYLENKITALGKSLPKHKVAQSIR